MSCRLCLRDLPLRNSHILPEFLYKAVYDDRHQYLVLSLRDGAQEVQQKGLREQLLCADCEQTLGRRERYASQLFFRTRLRPARDGDRLLVPGVDYVGFRLFLLGLLWKAGESSLEMFKRVRLGPHSERIRRLLLTESPGPPHRYPCLIAAFTKHQKFLKGSIGSPYETRIAEHRAYRFLFGGMGWTFLVSSHLTSAVAGRAVLREDGILPVKLLSERTSDHYVRSIAGSLHDREV